MGAYQKHLWDKILPMLQTLPDPSKTDTLNVSEEAYTLTRQQKFAAKHKADTASKSITVRRHAWLRMANILDDTKIKIEDLPFDAIGLFNSKTDEIVENIHKMRKTAKSYVPYQSYRYHKQAYKKPLYQSSTQYQPFRYNKQQRDRTYQPQQSTAPLFKQQRLTEFS